MSNEIKNWEGVSEQRVKELAPFIYNLPNKELLAIMKYSKFLVSYRKKEKRADEDYFVKCIESLPVSIKNEIENLPEYQPKK